MGIAAYNRGSAVIAAQIQMDFQNSGTARRERVAQMERARNTIEELESFCRACKEVLVAIKDESSAVGFALREARSRWLRLHESKRYSQLVGECIDAHCLWVDSDVTYVFEHLANCNRLARAYQGVLDILNPVYKWDFEEPRGLS